MAVTLQDIADAAGVHVMTVSRALRGEPRVADDTRERILGLAAEMGYRVHEAARAVRSGRFNRVLLVRSVDLQLRSWTPPGLIDLLEDAFTRRGLDLSLARVRDEELAADEGPSFLARRMADGIVLNYSAGASAELARQIEAADLPAVWVNARGQGCCVRPDEAGMMRTMVDHLVALGHRRIALTQIHHVPAKRAFTHYSSRDRREAYRRAMRAAGLEPQVELVHCPDNGDAPAAAAGLLSRLHAEGVTACVGLNGIAAHHFVLGAALAGLRIPRDLSLAVILWPQESGARVLEVDGCQIDDGAIARETADLLCGRIAGTVGSADERIVPGLPVWGRTTAPPPG